MPKPTREPRTLSLPLDKNEDGANLVRNAMRVCTLVHTWVTYFFNTHCDSDAMRARFVVVETVERKGSSLTAHNTENRMATKAQRNRTRLHVLRDNVHRAKRDVKLGTPGAAERLKAHTATRLAYLGTGR